MTLPTFIPWDDLVPRRDDKEQGEKRRIVEPHDMLCLECVLPDCNEKDRRCLLRKHHWIDYHGKMRSPETRAEFLSRRKGVDQEVRAIKRLMRRIG